MYDFFFFIEIFPLDQDPQLETRTAGHIKHFKMKLEGIAVPAGVQNDADANEDNEDTSMANDDTLHNQRSALDNSPTAAKSPGPSPTAAKSPRKLPKTPPVVGKTPSPPKTATSRLSKSPRSATVSPNAPETPRLDVSLQKPAANDKTPHQPSTPTTFGLDNTSMVRHLRKSMHPRQISQGSDTEPSPTKVHIETMPKQRATDKMPVPNDENTVSFTLRTIEKF